MVVFVLISVVFPICLLPFSLSGPGLEPHCDLCALDILGGFTTPRAFGVLLVNLGEFLELASLLGIMSVPCL